MKFARISLVCRLVALLIIVFASTCLVAQLPAQLTVQEALYPGASTSGIDRAQDPVTVGRPLADSAGINNISQLGLQGASVGQFRVLGRWPSGHIQWVLVDTQTDLHAGGKNTGISLTQGGTGNFGGPSLATDSGSTIIVNTGAAQFTIHKANFNIFDQVVSGGKTLVSSGSSQGLRFSGPSTRKLRAIQGPARPNIYQVMTAPRLRLSKRTDQSARSFAPTAFTAMRRVTVICVLRYACTSTRTRRL